MEMKSLIVDEMHESMLTMLSELGVDVDYRPDATREEIKSIISQYQGLVVRSKTFIDEEILIGANQLKFVARAGAGVDNIDEAAMQRYGVQLFNAPEGNRDAVAEQAVGMLLSLMHNIVKADREVRKAVWDREGNRGYELGGKTVGILGYGFMGQAFAQRLKGFGCRVLAYDKFKKDYSDQFCTESSMEQIFREADILSLHVPLTDETSRLVDDDYITRFKKPVFLLNTSRGKVLVLRDLMAHIRSGKVLGAGLDVLENEHIHDMSQEEKEVFQELVQLEKVVLTPHVAGWTYESYEKINRVLVEKIKNLLA